MHVLGVQFLRHEVNKEREKEGSNRRHALGRSHSGLSGKDDYYCDTAKVSNKKSDDSNDHDQTVRRMRRGSREKNLNR